MRQLPISDDDIVEIVRLLGQVSGMTEPLPERRRVLMLGLARMIDADVWMWIHSAGWGTDKVVGLAVIDGGWVDDRERALTVQYTYKPEWSDAIRAHLDFHNPSTWLFDESHPGFAPNEQLVNELMAEVGLRHLLFSTHPLPDGLFSNIGLHRRGTKPPYTPRDVALAHLVLGQVDWLHYVEPPAIVEEEGLRHLSPREREVMLYVLGGDGRKQIAARMGLSEHTIGGYFKSLYRRLNVSSRGELMAKFMPANRPSDSAE